jgi:hypothetical protein
LNALPEDTRLISAKGITPPSDQYNLRSNDRVSTENDQSFSL